MPKKGPYQLGPGCWTLGSVPRRSLESSGMPKAMTYREGETFAPDYVEEDQAIAINVRNKGLVVLSVWARRSCGAPPARLAPAAMGSRPT